MASIVVNLGAGGKHELTPTVLATACEPCSNRRFRFPAWVVARRPQEPQQATRGCASRRDAGTFSPSRSSLEASLVLTVDTKDADPMTKTPELLPGTLDLLILRTLQNDPMHGWAISERIQQISQDVLQINQGSLYPALHRLEHRGWVEAEWKVSELGRRAKYYRLTTSGRRQLAVEAREWDRMANAIGRVMKLA
jgi:transcriptional regulator